MTLPATIAERWHAARARVDAACERAGRSPADVTIVAVSKTHPAAAVREAAAAGATDFGENYAQELAAKRAELAGEPAIRWHYIGRLQRNKAKLVAGHVALVHAVDTAELAAELGKRSAQVQPVLLAINAAGEQSKGGVTAEQATGLARSIAGTPNAWRVVTMRLTTTERTWPTGTASLVVDVYGLGRRSSGGCSSVCTSTTRVGVSTSTVMCRRTSSRSNVGSWCRT